MDWSSFVDLQVPDEYIEQQRILLTVATSLSQNDVRPHHSVLLQSAADAVHKSMRFASSKNLYHARRIHTDCCIIQSLVETSLGSLQKAIAILDSALIISGATGQGRYLLIHELILKNQNVLSSPKATRVEWPSNAETPPLATDVLPSAAQAIPRIPAPSFTAFQSYQFKQPFIISKYAADWPALQEHPWNRATYLLSVAGPGRMVPVEVGGNYLMHDWTQRIMPWNEFLSMLNFEDRPATTNTADKHYLAQHDLFMQFPALRNDILIPDYIYASSNFHKEFPEYKPPPNDEGLVTNVWIGPQCTLSPAHTDPYNNFYVQVMGQKTVWLAPPNMSKYLSPGQTESMVGNTSEEDVFGDVNGTFLEHVQPHAMSAVLQPGDLLYFPTGWWHAMRSESSSISLSLWF